MAGVDAPGPARDLGQFDDLGLFGVGAGNVLESGRESDGTVGHRLLHKRLHSSEFFRGRRAPLGSHDGAAHRVVADQRRVVHRNAGLLDACERGREVLGGSTAVACHHRRHAHLDEMLRQWMVGDFIGVGVHVDESWTDDLAARFEDRRCSGRAERADRGNPAVSDANICRSRRCAGAIDDASASDENVKGLFRLSCTCAVAAGQQKQNNRDHCGAHRLGILCFRLQHEP